MAHELMNEIYIILVLTRLIARGWFVCWETWEMLPHEHAFVLQVLDPQVRANSKVVQPLQSRRQDLAANGADLRHTFLPQTDQACRAVRVAARQLSGWNEGVVG